MKVIGVGLGRTGTSSIEEAFALLGYETFNMGKLVSNGLFDPWLKKLTDAPDAPSWEELFEGYDATIAWPGCFFYDELLEVYPDAKFILTTRDPESWAQSFTRSVLVLEGITKLRFIPRVNAFAKLMNQGIMPRLTNWSRDVELAKQTIIEHDEKVRATIPPEKLLIYEASQGWEPLCELLGEPVPDVPFPHINTSGDFAQTVRKALGLSSES